MMDGSVVEGGLIGVYSSSGVGRNGPGNRLCVKLMVLNLTNWQPMDLVDELIGYIV
jgi:hypothetical protein